MIRLLALVQKNRGIAPGQRFRLEQWAPHLEEHYGISLDSVAFESPELTSILYERGRWARKAWLVSRDSLRRREVLRLVHEYDGVVVYREASLLGPAIYERLLARMKVPIIFDFDDAIWMRGPGSANGVFSRLTFRGKTATVCRLASAVVVGNRYLATYASRHSKSVTIIPSTIELAQSPVQPPLQNNGPFTLVWAGSSSSLAQLESVKGALARVGQKRSTLLRVICSRPPTGDWGKVRIEFVPWSATDEAVKLGQSHVGIMPLIDDAFARGKCALKALQYMAVGRPVVASAVGANADLIVDGQNGYLAATEDEWVAKLECLAESDTLRQRLGSAGRRTVEAHYTASHGAGAFAAVVNDVLGRKFTHI